MRGAGCAEGVQEGPLECPVDAETVVWQWLGPGNTNVAVGRLGWVVPRYSTLPVPSLLHHPGYSPSRYPPAAPPAVDSGSSRNSTFGSTKEILGVGYAQYLGYGYQLPHASPYAGPAASPGACSVGPAVRLQLGLARPPGLGIQLRTGLYTDLYIKRVDYRPLYSRPFIYILCYSQGPAH